MSDHSVTADAILALINSKPRSPTKDELVAVLASHLEPAPWSDPAGHRAEWDAALVAYAAAEEDYSLTDEEMDEFSGRVDACARRIMTHPVRGPAGIGLLAEICFWARRREPSGLRGPAADQLLAYDPGRECTTISDEALAALLRAIRDIPHAQLTSRVHPKLAAAIGGRMIGSTGMHGAREFSSSTAIW